MEFKLSKKDITGISESIARTSIIFETVGFRAYINYEDADFEDKTSVEDYLENMDFSAVIHFAEKDFVRGDSTWGRWNKIKIVQDGSIEHESDDNIESLFDFNNEEENKNRILNLGERDAYLKEFYNWIESTWEYKIRNTLFMKSLKPKGKFYSFIRGKIKKKSIYDSLLLNKRWTDLFRVFVSFSLNEGSTNISKLIVKENLVSNIFINDSKEVTLLLNYEDYDPSLDLEEISSINKDLLMSVNPDEYEFNGFSKRLIPDIKQIIKEGDLIVRSVYMHTFDYESCVEGDEDKVVWGLPSFFSRIKYKKRVDEKENKTFKINTSDFQNGKDLIEFSPSSNEKVFVIPVNVLELVHFVKKVKDKEGSIDSLFNLNVRDRKGLVASNKIFKGIKNTIATDHKYFFMMNNGITAIVDKADMVFSEKQEKTIILENIKIINGQQTTNSLFEIFQKEQQLIKNLKDTKIMMKVFVVNNKKSDLEKRRIFNKIASASNTQNKVNDRDIISTFEFNSILSEMLMKLGIYYKFRDGQSDYSKQFKGMPNVTIQEIIKMDYMFYSGDMSAKNLVNKITTAILDYATTGTFKKSNKYNEYAKNFVDKPEQEKAVGLLNSASITAYFKAKKKMLKISDIKNESAAMDALIYTALKMNEKNMNWKEIDILEFAEICYELRTSLDRGQNTFYKSAVNMKELWIILKGRYLDGNKRA